eukprot:7294550-Pyramimonas_sp.AAC.1
MSGEGGPPEPYMVRKAAFNRGFVTSSMHFHAAGKSRSGSRCRRARASSRVRRARPRPLPWLSAGSEAADPG